MIRAVARAAAGQQQALPFDDWRAGLMAEARDRGFSDALVNEALADVEPRKQVIRADRNQAEVVQTLEQVLPDPSLTHDGRARTGPGGRARAVARADR